MNEMVAAHDNKVYPPRFRYAFYGGEENEKVTFVFEGLKKSQQYDVLLTASVSGIYVLNTHVY